MNSKNKSLKWFTVSFLASFGSYLLFSLRINTEDLGEALWGLSTLILYIFISLPLIFVLRKKNTGLTSGLIWGLIAITVYLFTFGGCGLATI